MIIPEFIKPGDTVGITAPSDGIGEPVDIIRLENGERALESRGYRTLETNDVRKSIGGRSAGGKARAEEFMGLMKNRDVRCVFSASGGDYLFETLDYIDFNEIRDNPKWFQGYSDNTGITYTLTTISDVASVYAGNFSDFGMKTWHKSLLDNIGILEGNNITQRNYDKYETSFQDRVTGDEEFVLTEPVSYHLLGGNGAARAEGRLLGGCLDVLIALCGTKFDNTRAFIDKYRDDGIIWYIESFGLASERIEIALWQLKSAGWFDTAKAFIFGRPCFFSSGYEVSFDDAVKNAIHDFDVPIITGADIGHRPPRFTMINGAKANIEYLNNDFTLTYDLNEV